MASTSPKLEASAPAKIDSMAKLVNYEGNMVPINAVPQGSVYIRGVWYSSMDNVPDEVKRALRESKSNK